MAQLTALIVSHDEEFKRQAAQMLRACGIPVGIVDGRGAADGSAPDVAVVDLRSDASSGMAAIERLRAGAPGMSIFAIAQAAEPDLILGSMRAGANEFFPWMPGGQSQRTMEESFHGAVRKTAMRREAASAGSRQPCVTHVFLGAKGGAGTTTVSVNCAVEVARVTKRPTIISPTSSTRFSTSWTSAFVSIGPCVMEIRRSGRDSKRSLRRIASGF